MQTKTQAKKLGELLDELSDEIRGVNVKDEWLSPKQVAEELQMHQNTVYRIIGSGQLPVYDLAIVKQGKRCYRIRRSDMDNWLKDRRRGQ